MKTITDLTIEQYREKVKEFHGHEAPGLLIGGFMVDLAIRNLPAGEFFDCICETSVCLPDAVQILTPCTIGNGWLKIIDAGKFAVTFYDKAAGAGTRVYLDIEKLKAYDEVFSWFMKLKTKKEQNKELLISQIIDAGDRILSVKKVRVTESFLGKRSKGKNAICPGCGEPYPASDGDKCKGCSGIMPYLSSN